MYDEEIKIDIALIKQKMEFVEEAVSSLKGSIDKIVTKDEFETHNLQDKWLFGIIITILIGTLVKMFFN